jgi:hypothetical protein
MTSMVKCISGHAPMLCSSSRGLGGGIGLAPVLISTQRLALITGVGSISGAPGSFLFLLRSLPGSLMGITLALLTTLSLSLGS